MTGAPKGGRVHTVLFYTRLNSSWKIYTSKYGHNYAFIYTYPKTLRAIALVARTSARCFRITLWDGQRNTITYTSTTTAHKCAVIINKFSASIPIQELSIKKEQTK